MEIINLNDRVHSYALLLFFSRIHGEQVSAFWLHKFLRRTGTNSIDSEKRLKNLIDEGLIIKPSEGAYAITDSGQVYCDSRNLASILNEKILEEVDRFVLVFNTHRSDKLKE